MNQDISPPTHQHVGGTAGHVLRRAVHLSMLIVPILYYWYGNSLAATVALNREQLLGIILLLIVIGEIIRLWFGWTFVGQRSYEANRVSALTWSALAVGLVLLLAPAIGPQGAAYGVPIIWAMSLTDPLLGEMRRYRIAKLTTALAGIICVAIVWGIASVWLATPWWLIPIMAPITVAVEWPSLRWIDDNALMLVIPLALVWLLVTVW